MTRAPGTGRRLDRTVAASWAACLALVAIGAFRFLSYPGSPLHEALDGTPLAFLAWNPEHRWTSRFLKVLATPSVIAGLYLLFRLLNRMHRQVIDFRSPWLRLLLVLLVSVHWLWIEAAKFGRPGFDMRSDLERPVENAAVLLVGAAIAFFGMRHLAFGPLFRDPPAAGAPPATAGRRDPGPGTGRPSGRD